MGSRSSHLRTKVVALLASLACLWAFAAWVTLRDGLNLLGVQTLNTKVFEPSEPLLLQLQSERRASLIYLGKPNGQQHNVLDTERQKTDDLAATFKESAQNWLADLASSTELGERIDELTAGLDELAETRTAIDTRTIERDAATTTYTDIVASIFRVYDSMGQLDDAQIAKDTATLIEIQRARELMSQEDALLSGAIAAGRITTAEHAQFAQLVGAQRFLATRAAVELPEADRARYDQAVNGTAFIRLRNLEDRLIQTTRTGGKPAVDADDWNGTAESTLTELRDVVLTGGEEIVQRAAPVAVWVIIRMLLAAGLGLITVIASIIVSVTTARALMQQLERLRDAAWQLANERLPKVVDRLRRGEDVDVATEAPPLAFGTDEIGQVGQAFNAVQETAIRAAVEQAELRSSVRDIFLSLARRTQALVHRQLTLLDAMERRENDAEELEDLFRVDHLATRMRRNAENLIVLSGATPGRTWRRNVPMIDVVRGAVAEVEDYTRVAVLPIGPVGLAGRAVGDVIHLLAELIENALSFSPPHTGVQVNGQMVANGYVIEIEDRGLGMSEEELADANEQITSHPEFSLSNAARLGLYVVSRLTERHGVRVQLKESPYGGTTAVVLIPLDLVTDSESSDGDGPGTGTPSRRRTTIAAGGTAPRHEAGRSAAEPPANPGGSVAVTDTPRAQPTLDRPQTPAGPPPRSTAAPGPQTPAAPAEQTQPQQGEASITPSGLPFRVRQASLAPALREEPATSSEPPADEDVPRPPDQVRQMMSSYQTGTRRGRSEAARMLDDTTDPPPAPAGT